MQTSWVHRIFVLTAATVMLKNLTVTSLEGQSATLSWEVNGEDAWNIYFFELTVRPLPRNPTISRAGLLKQSIDADKRTADLTNLQAETIYQVYLAPFTKNGENNKMATVAFKTTEGLYLNITEIIRVVGNFLKH